jgi:hypothetical protein
MHWVPSKSWGGVSSLRFAESVAWSPVDSLILILILTVTATATVHLKRKDGCLLDR